jgi:arylsulfatase A-like enzyme
MTPLKDIKNILLLSVEDLNDWIEPLKGHPQAYTPNISRLAKRAVVFDQAYAAAPACSPSRTSTLFGQAPWRTGIYHNRHSWAMQFEPGENLSIIGQAHSAGWKTYGAGKVFHMTGKSGLDTADWTEYFHTPTDKFSPISRAVQEGLLNSLEDFGPIPNDTPPLYDDRGLSYIKSKINKGADKNLWAFGTYRPHLPLIVPQRFYDLIKQPIQPPPGLGGKVFDPNNYQEIRKLPKEAKKLIRRNSGMGKVLNETGEYDELVHAYLASIAYADYLVGELLDHMEETGGLDSTLIVFWSDHGWQIGEKLAFRKFTLWERALRVPLFISLPKGPRGKSSEPVSLMDIYPTLLNIIGQDPPHAVDGQDLLPVINGEKGRGYALSMWELHHTGNALNSTLSSSVRTQQYRLIHYHDGAMELYDHENDPYEQSNLLHGGYENLGENILHICSDLLEHLPQDPCEAHLPNSESMEHRMKNINTRHPKLNGTEFIY